MRLAANLSFLFKDRPFMQRFGAASACGFKHVEFMFPGDGGYVHDAAAVRGALSEHGLTQVLLNAPAGDWAAGDRGLAGVPGRDTDFASSMERGLRFAEEVGCSRMHVMAGTIAAGATEDTLVSRLRWASGMAADANVCLLVEPLNPVDFPGYLVPDASTALRVLDAVDAHNCQLQLDLYHLAMAGGLVAGDAASGEAADLPRLVRDLLPRSAHVQLANPPGRNEPGVGFVDFAPLLALLEEAGYDGFVGCEYKPSTEVAEDSFEWAESYGVRAP